MMMTDCVSQNPAVLSSVESPPTPPARDQEMMKVAYSMQRTCKGLIVSADTANAAHRYIKKMLVFFRVPPPVVHLYLGDVRYIDEASYPSEWDRLMSGHVYLRALGAEFVPGHFNAEGVKIAAFLRQYLRPGRNAAQHRLLISTRLSAARFSKRYSNDVLQLVLANCLPVKLRTIKEEWL